MLLNAIFKFPKLTLAILGPDSVPNQPPTIGSGGACLPEALVLFCVLEITQEDMRVIFYVFPKPLDHLSEILSDLETSTNQNHQGSPSRGIPYMPIDSLGVQSFIVTYTTHPHNFCS